MLETCAQTVDFMRFGCGRPGTLSTFLHNQKSARRIFHAEHHRLDTGITTNLSTTFFVHFHLFVCQFSTIYTGLITNTTNIFK